MNPDFNRTFRLAQTFMNNELKHLNLSSGLYNYLLELADGKHRSMKELSVLVGVDNGYTTRAISKLEQRKLVVKFQSEEDGRSYLVSLTEEGEKLIPVIEDSINKWVSIISKGVSEKDIKLVLSTFSIFRNNAESYMGKEF